MSKLFYKLGKHPNNSDGFTAKDLEFLHAKVGKDIGFSFTVGTIKVSPTQFVPALGDMQYYIACQPNQRDKIAQVLLKSKIAYVSMIGREEVPGNSEL